MKKINGTRGSYVDRDGTVWSTFLGTNPIPPRARRTVENKGGYLTVGLWVNGKLRTHLIHRLVAEAFLEKPKNHVGRFVVNHKNGNKLDNRLENLEWCNDRDNSNHRVRVLRQNPTAKVSNSSAMDLVFFKQTNGHDTKTLSSIYKISKGQIRLIERGVWRSWIWSDKDLLSRRRGNAYSTWLDGFRERLSVMQRKCEEIK